MARSAAAAAAGPSPSPSYGAGAGAAAAAEREYEFLVAAFIDDFHRMPNDILRDIAAAVGRGSLARRDAVVRVAEMLEVQAPDIGDASSGSSPAAAAAQPAADGGSGGQASRIAQLRAAAAARHKAHLEQQQQQSGSFHLPPVRGGAASQSPSQATPPAAFPQSNNYTAATPSVRLVDCLLADGTAVDVVLEETAVRVKELRVLWQTDVVKAVARAQLFCGTAEGLGIVAQFLSRFRDHQRMKDKVQLPQLPLMLGLISTALSNSRSAHNPDALLAASIGTVAALLTRFDARIANLLKTGGAAPDAMNAAAEAKTQFQVLRQQLRDLTAGRADAIGQEADDVCSRIR